MQVQDLALVRGLGPTRGTLVRWNARPGPVLLAWSLGSLTVAALLLGAVYLVALAMQADPTPLPVLGITAPPSLDDVAQILHRNALVLALHAFACVAGYIAGSSLPREAARRSGIWRRVHDAAGPLAIAFVTAATLFSLMTQAFVIGSTATTVSAQLGIAPGLLLVALLPHALLELWALFLPLAAWLIASRRGRWDELLAATVVTVTIAIPVLILASVIEVYVSPHLLAALIR
ncbi:MAG: stage II sporulation protein M [Actinobacteria bacterium]|nr:stage II sporulation protein M [Actinomycetota bacterium]